MADVWSQNILVTNSFNSKKTGKYNITNSTTFGKHKAVHYSFVCVKCWNYSTNQLFNNIVKLIHPSLNSKSKIVFFASLMLKDNYYKIQIQSIE